MTEIITSVGRDVEVTLDVEPATQKDARYMMMRYRDPDYIRFQVTSGPGWWGLDDVCRIIVGDGVWISSYSNWLIVSMENARRIIGVFDAIGKLDRLKFRAMPAAVRELSNV